jgi:hypothetical protein
MGTAIFIESQEPYINNSDSRMMTLSQGLLAVIIACGTGSTEISAGNNLHQAFVSAVILGLAIPGTILLAYSVADPDLSWAKQQCEKRCARQTNPSAAVHPSEGEHTSGEPAQSERGQMQAVKQNEVGAREQEGPEGAGIIDGDSADEIVCIASLGAHEGGTEDEQDSMKEQIVESLEQQSLAAVDTDQEL